MLGFDNAMISSNQSNHINGHDSNNDASKASLGTNAACFFNNKADYRLDTLLLGIASSSLFANMESLGPVLSFQQESRARARVGPLDMISEVLLEELSEEEIVGSADVDHVVADTFALEPTPLDTSRMNIVDSLPLNLYYTQDLSLFKETHSTKNISEEPPLPFSHPVTFMPWCGVSDISTSGDSSRKRKHQLEGNVQETVSKGQRKQQQDEEDARQFRPYQAGLWTVKFAELLEFKQLKGHCCVPFTYGKNPALARWVKRQRYQYKLKMEGKPSTMTDDRVEALEEHGFIWGSRGAAWQERWNELVKYQGMYGDCNVPSSYASNPSLATWVKCQRRQYKLYFEGKANPAATPERIAELESLGFEWELRKSSK